MDREGFQYITVTYPERELNGRLTELGLAGWELITAKWEEYSYGGRAHNQAKCILKRRITIGVDGEVFAPDGHRIYDIYEYQEETEPLGV